MIGKWWAKRQAKKRLQQEKNIILSASNIDISSINTLICLAGPYRNLTTLTASVAALHPNCQVLNHAHERILPHHEVDFFSDYTSDKWNRFLQYGLRISLGGERGRTGGSIMHSHAFDHGNVKDLYQKRYAENPIKDHVKSILWKEGLYLANHLRKHNVDPLYLIKQQKKLKFVLPIRNVLDCAVSNKKTTLAFIFDDINEDSSLKEIITAILEEHLAFFKRQQKMPAHFFHFFEHSFDKETLIAYCHFANIPFDEQWALDVLSIFNIKSKYTHCQETIQFYKEEVENKFDDYPEIKTKLLAFCN